jgi:hypothetical protein
MSRRVLVWFLFWNRIFFSSESSNFSNQNQVFHSKTCNDFDRHTLKPTTIQLTKIFLCFHIQFHRITQVLSIFNRLQMVNNRRETWNSKRRHLISSWHFTRNYEIFITFCLHNLGWLEGRWVAEDVDWVQEDSRRSFCWDETKFLARFSIVQLTLFQMRFFRFSLLLGFFHDLFFFHYSTLNSRISFFPWIYWDSLILLLRSTVFLFHNTLKTSLDNWSSIPTKKIFSWIHWEVSHCAVRARLNFSPIFSR